MNWEEYNSRIFYRFPELIEKLFADFPPDYLQIYFTEKFSLRVNFVSLTVLPDDFFC